MGTNTRYNKLRDTLKTDFSRNRTYEVDTASDSREVIFNLGDFDAIGNDSFLASGPFNSVTVRNYGDADVRIYLSSDRELFVRVPASTGAVATLDAIENVPKRYISFLEVENLETDGTAADVTIQVGNEIDSVELDLLKMSGLLDIQE